ncbi:MAG: amidase [Dongiaceae bacterium]
MQLAEYAALDGLGLAHLVRTGQVSPRELAATALRAIAVANPAVQAVIETYEDAADALDEAALGTGPFRGVPFLIKDVGQSFGGRKCEQGSRLGRGMVVAKDDYFAGLVKASGVTLVGRSNTPEFSMALCSENLLFGNTTTPWKAGYSTSGSTGGGAAAVAAGMVPIAHGSDMGGSIRGPAAWCGTIGLYPSRGRVSSGPLFDEGGHGMTQRFAMTRTMRDTATMLDCLGRPQPGDPFVIARPPLPFAAYLERPAEPLRIAWSAAPLMDAPIDPEVAAAVQATARVLEGLGHHVEEAAPPLDLPAIDRACTAVWYFGFDQWLDDLARRTGRVVGPDTVERMTLRFYEWSKRLPCERYLAALEEFNQIRRGVGRFFTRYDIWLSPTCAQVSRPFGTYGMNQDMQPEEFLAYEERPCQFLVPYNVTGQPAISLPLALHSSGLPIGVQLGARHSEEHLLIQLGAALEQAMPWRGRVPPLHVSRLAG